MMLCRDAIGRRSVYVWKFDLFEHIAYLSFSFQNMSVTVVIILIICFKYSVLLGFGS